MSWMDELLDAGNREKYLDQGSEAWEQIRVGRFTSSEIYKIMECGYRPMTAEELAGRPKSGKGSKTTRVLDPTTMSETGMKYIYQKVAEVLTEQAKPAAYAYPLVWGKEQEPFAVEYFQEKFGLECLEVGFQPWSDHAGGSPDRLIGDDQGLEIKCPYDSTNQINYLMLTDRWDLKRLYPEYYWQCVSLLLFTGRKKWHFCTFDHRMKLDKHKLTHMEIMYSDVQEDIDALNLALTGAISEKIKLINLLS